MNKIIYLFSLLVLLHLDSPLSAQTNIRYFPPERVKGDFQNINTILRHDQFIYIAGSAFGEQPAVVKIDTSGREIWSFTLNMELDKDAATRPYGGSIMRAYGMTTMFADSNRVYVQLWTYNFSDFILAIDAKNGNLLWRIPYTDGYSNRAFWDAGQELALLQGSKYRLLDKETGQVVFTKEVRSFSTIYVDKDGTTYLTRKDTVEKYNSARLESLLWQNNVFGASNYEPGIVAMELRDDGYVYYYGKQGSFYNYFVGKLAKADGTVAWNKVPVRAEGVSAPLNERPHDIVFKGDYVYVLPLDVYAGGSITGFHAVKFNKDDGTIIWNKLYDQEGKPRDINASGFNSGDVDDNGNLYGSGHLWDDQWRIMKLNADGKFIYSNSIITEGDVPDRDDGLLTFVLDNKVYHIGFMTETGVRKLFMVSTDTSGSYVPLSIKKIQVALQHPGSIKAMAPIADGGFVMYRQQDRNAVLEARNNADKSVRWSTVFSSEDYQEADRLHVRGDNLIAVTGLSHRSAKKQADYQRSPYMIQLGRYDAAGKTLQYRALENSYGFSFESVQLINGNASNAGYVFSANGYDELYGDLLPVRYYHVNLSLADTQFEAFEDFGFTKPYAGLKQFVIPYMQDSVLFGGTWTRQDKTQIVGTSAYYTSVRPNYWDPEQGVKYVHSWTPEMRDAEFTNFASVDGGTFTILGRGMPSDSAMVVRYNVPYDSVLFVSTLSTALTLHNASSDAGGTYCTGNIGPSLAAVKLNNRTGKVTWQKSLAAGPRQCYFPLDQQINTHTNEYIICGYIVDSSYLIARKLPFYVIFDANGNVTQQWTGQPDYIGNNQLNTVCVTSDGQTLIGGAFYTRAAGKAAILITIGGVEPPIEMVEMAICSSSELALDAKRSGERYQWQINKGNGFMDLENGGGISGTATAGLRINNPYFPQGQYTFRCLVDGNTDDRIFNVKIASNFTPEVSIKGDTLVRAGKEAVIVAKLTYGGELPSLQWEDSTAAHSWMPIPGATSDTLLYMPAKMKSKVRCVLTSSLACAGGVTVVSKGMPVFIDPLTSTDPSPATQYGIKVFPNPVTDVLTISNLRVIDRWNVIQVLRMNGEVIYTMNAGHQTNVSIPAGKWEAGMYILVLRKKNGESAQFRFLKM